MLFLTASCRPVTLTTHDAGSAPQPPTVSEPRLAGLVRCGAAQLDDPEPSVPRPVPVHFKALPLDPVFRAMGISLVTFRSAELVFHVSPDLPQATVDCTVAAADDAVAFVTRTLEVPRGFDGGPTRDVFLSSPEAAEGVLDSLDPGRRFEVGPDTGITFVGSPRARPRDWAIFQWKRLPLDYLRIGFMYAHEWVHMIQNHSRGEAPRELDAVIEGEANLLAAHFEDAALPGSGSVFWDRDAKRLAEARSQHPELTLRDLLTQRPHRHHDEISLFAAMARGVAPAALGRIRLLVRAERLDYESAWRRVVGRELVEPGLDAVVRDPKVAPRPSLATPLGAPALRVVRSDEDLWFVAVGFRPDEPVTRSVTLPEGRVDSDPLRADSRGVVAWTWRLRAGTRFAPRDVEIRGESGVCSGRYHDRL